MSDSRQSTLDEYIERLARPTPPVTTQDRELRRALSAQQAAVLTFCRAHVGRPFHGGELLEHVRAAGIVAAPDSPRRVLSELARLGLVSRRLLDRRASLFVVDEVE